MSDVLGSNNLITRSTVLGSLHFNQASKLLKQGAQFKKIKEKNMLS